ncbi:MAG: hypothetical protein EBT44_03170 [Actinobacteria bacterium]|uniref:Uncharacterized protein n=1 Tax=Candidatus Fonsibacter lacus TaxID=2576439 RepID=A0A965GDU7_9PROT|nr:hypothetical protein [Candidatus Fonsibacter lacus]
MVIKNVELRPATEINQHEWKIKEECTHSEATNELSSFGSTVPKRNYKWNQKNYRKKFKKYA